MSSRKYKAVADRARAKALANKPPCHGCGLRSCMCGHGMQPHPDHDHPDHDHDQEQEYIPRHKGKPVCSKEMVENLVLNLLMEHVANGNCVSMDTVTSLIDVAIADLPEPVSMMQIEAMVLEALLNHGIKDAHIKEVFEDCLKTWNISPECIRKFAMEAVLELIPKQVTKDDVVCYVEDYFGCRLHSEAEIKLIALECLNKQEGQLWSQSQLEDLIDRLTLSEEAVLLLISQNTLSEAQTRAIAKNVLLECQRSENDIKAIMLDCLKDLADEQAIDPNTLSVDMLCDDGALMLDVALAGVSRSVSVDLSGKLGNVDVQDGEDGKDGEDGFSPIVQTNPVAGGNTITIVDANGASSLFIADGQNGSNGTDGEDGEDGEKGTDGEDGEAGEDGFSPLVSSTYENGVTTLTIITAEGSQVLQIRDGAAGQNGLNGANGIDGENGQDGSLVSCDTSVPNQTSILVDGNIICTIPHNGNGNGGGSIITCTETATTATLLIDGVEACTLPKGVNGQDGQDGQDGRDGRDGQDGVSPTFSTNTNATGTTVTLTDVNGPTSFFIPNGSDGEDGNDGEAGEDGQDGVSPTLNCVDTGNAIALLINGETACSVTKGTVITCQTVNGTTTLYGDGIALCAITGNNGIELGGGTITQNPDGTTTIVVTDVAGNLSSTNIQPQCCVESASMEVENGQLVLTITQSNGDDVSTSMSLSDIVSCIGVTEDCDEFARLMVGGEAQCDLAAHTPCTDCKCLTVPPGFAGTVELRINETGTTQSIDWGDGSAQSGPSGTYLNHTFISSDLYRTITICNENPCDGVIYSISQIGLDDAICSECADCKG